MDQNTVWIYENSIGKITFAWESPYWITMFDGMSSVEVDITQSRGPRQIGATIASQSVRPRSFTLDGCLFDPVGVNRDRLIDIIAPQVPATLTMVDGAESWYLDVVPEKTPEIEPGLGVQNFQLRLFAAYPYWRTTASYSTQIAGLISMFKFPFYTGGNWWISKYSDSYFRSIENQGNVPLEFKLTFTARAALTNPELYHVDTRQRIAIRKNMVAGERVTVSTVYGERGVIVTAPDGTASNGFRHLTIDSDLSMTLQPGSNLLRIDADINREGLGVRLEAPQGVKSGV